MERNVPKLRFKGFNDKWKGKKVESIFEKVKNPVNVEKEKYYRQIGIRSHGKGLFYKDYVTGLELGNKRVFWVESDVFIVNIVFAWERAVAKTTKKEVGMIASHRFPMYKPKKNILDLDFITYMFTTQKGQSLLELASPGGAGRNKTLGQKEFDNLMVNLPSLEEQERIANFLTKVDKIIEKQDEKVKNLEKYKKGMMQKIFSQEIRFKDENGKEYPEWKNKNLGELGETYTGLSGKTKENFGVGTSKFITYMNVFKNIKVNFSMLDLVEVGENEKQNKVIKNDLLFTTSSETPEEVGMVSVCNENIENLYLNSFCFGFRINDKESINSEFMSYLLRSPENRLKISTLAQGSTRYNLSKSELMKMKIKIPCIEEQNSIVELLNNIDCISINEQEKLLELKQWKRGLLQQMFV